MKYPVSSDAIIDVTKPPYCADNTGKTDCTVILRKILDDVLSCQVKALKQTHDKLVMLSDGLKEDVYIGIESGRVQDGQLVVTFPEFEPDSRILYFPKGTYLVSDTVTYTLEDLKQYWYWVPLFENNRNIHFMGESKKDTVIRLKDNSKGFGKGEEKPVVSFVNNELKVPREQEFTNTAFMNTIEDITIDCGSGNPGAVGIKYVSSNCGRIENVSIRSDSGSIGIYFANNSTQGVFSDIDISGFDYGMDIFKSCMIMLDCIDFSGCRIAGIHSGDSTVALSNIVHGNIPAVKFRPGSGRYFFADGTADFSGDTFDNRLIFEHNEEKIRKTGIPRNTHEESAEDCVLVDDFGAKGDGTKDSTCAIRKAMNSGKAHIFFGKGRYVINAKIKIPASVKTIDFMFCSLECGTRLVGGEYDAAFEISEDSDDLLFMENLCAFEQFRGHMRLVKHAARRDAVFSDIWLMSAALYFNSVPGSKVWFDNCFLTMGTYPRSAWIPGNGFVPVYCGIIPYELHGQTAYGRQINPERADLALLNDGSDILLDGFRTEGCGTAVGTVNCGNTRVNLFNAGIGCSEAENPLFDIKDAGFLLTGANIFGLNEGQIFKNLIFYTEKGKTKKFMWEDFPAGNSVFSRIIEKYKSSDDDNRS